MTVEAGILQTINVGQISRLTDPCRQRSHGTSMWMYSMAITTPSQTGINSESQLPESANLEATTDLTNADDEITSGTNLSQL